MLENEGYSVSCAPTCADANKYFIRNNPDLVLLDVMLPDGNGFDIAKSIKKTNQVLPIIFLTSCTDIQDLRTGFEIGCEDYIKKPAQAEELLLRVRRAIGDFDPGIGFFRKIGLYRFNPITQKLYFGDESQDIGNLESSILDELCSLQGETIYKLYLVNKYWGDSSVYSSRNLDSIIVKLRKRIAKDDNIRIISLKKIGYRLVFS